MPSRRSSPPGRVGPSKPGLPRLVRTHREGRFRKPTMSTRDRHRFASIAPYLPSVLRRSVAVICGAPERERNNRGRRGVTGGGGVLWDSHRLAVLPGYRRNRFDGSGSGEALPRSRHRRLRVKTAPDRCFVGHTNARALLTTLRPSTRNGVFDAPLDRQLLLRLRGVCMVFDASDAG